MSKKRVVIAGMVFGGLRAAKVLAGSDVELMMNWTYAYWFQERQVRLITARKRRAVSLE